MIDRDTRRLDTAFLDLFRGLAALWVVVAHCAIWSSASVDQWGLFEPKKAVDLFMIISGFLMFYTVEKNAHKQSVHAWSTWRSFYIRRFLRISPVYYLALAVVLIAWPTMSEGITSLQSRHPEFWNTAPAYMPANQNLSFGSIILHLTYLFGLFPTLSFSTQLPDWSLSLEMQFYVALPLIYLACVRFGIRKTSLILTIVSLAITKVIGLAILHGRMPAFEEPSLLVLKLPAFLAGAMLYQSAVERNAKNYVVTGIVLIAALRQYRFDGLLLAVSIAAFIFCAFSVHARRLSPLLKSKPVSLLAHTSFSAYLLHGFAIAFAGPGFLSWADAALPANIVVASFAIVVLLITYPVSYLLYRTVETWGNDLGKHITGRQVATAPPIA
jgi:peptidoglycan/LPS O-acetylase OafA/YrhL